MPYLVITTTSRQIVQITDTLAEANTVAAFDPTNLTSIGVNFSRNEDNSNGQNTLPIDAIIGWYVDTTNRVRLQEVSLTEGVANTLKYRVHRVARIFSKGLRVEFAINSVPIANNPLAALITPNSRYSNSFNRGKSWIGYAWAEIMKYEGEVADAMTESELETLMSTLETEMPNEDSLLTWHARHNINTWKIVLDLQRIYTTNFSTYGTNTLTATINNTEELDGYFTTNFNNAVAFSVSTS